MDETGLFSVTFETLTPNDDSWHVQLINLEP
jgi:hypothetical protein